jgi:UDP-N-acetylmuramoyl-L-alanyl-D-glutamate--2,6-diaminopimelate ligase
MQLRELIAEMNVLEVHGSTAVEIAGISYDARRVLPGDVYVALQRGASDGHSEIELALERGAVAVICRRISNLRQRSTRIEVTDTRLALAELASVFYGQAGEKLHVIGVTGGSDAWKAAHLTKQLLQAAGVKTGLISSLRHEIGERTLPSAHFAEASDIQRLFAGMVRSGCTACVLELPAISPAYLKGIPLNVLLYQGGEQNLRALSLFLQTRPGAPVCGIVNIDEESGRVVAQSNIFKMQLGYGFNAEAEVSASNLECTPSSSRFILNLAGHSAACEVPLVGRQNVGHLLGAAAACLSSLTARQVLSAMSVVRTAPSALESVPNEHGLNIYIDEAARADAIQTVLAEVRRMQSGRVLMAFGSAAGTSGKDRFDLGKAAAQFVDHIILTSDNPAGENPEHICSVIAQGIESAGRARYHIELDRAQAIRELIAMAEPGDTVLITGKGERTHQIVGSTVVPFNDREIATDFLQNYVRTETRRNVGPAMYAAA